ncbi:MAG TPA: cupin domain-containing protein [Gaiellaceae bacterium]
MDAQLLADGRAQQLGIAYRRQVDEARGQLRGQLIGDGEGEPRLAGPARPREGDQPRLLAEHGGHGRDLQLPADERCRRPGQARLQLVGALRGGQHGVLAENGAFELAQLRRRLDPELVERRPRRLVGVQRLFLATGAVEREHLLPPKGLAERMLGDQSLQPAQQGVVTTERELGVAEQLDGVQPPLLQPFPPALRQRLGGEIRERRPLPERERLAQATRGSVGPAGTQLSLGLRDQRLEPLEVELAGLEHDPVAGAAGLDPLRPEGLPQAVDVDLERLDGRGRRRLAPERVDEGVARHRLACPEQQRRQQRALLRPPEVERLAFRAGLDRSQDPEFHGFLSPRTTRQANAKRMLSAPVDGALQQGRRPAAATRKGDANMIRTGTVIENPVTGERIVFRKTSRDTGGEAVVIETFVQPHGFVAAAHVHPGQEERFEVLKGSIGFKIGREQIVAGPGQRLTVPAGTPHRFWNAGDTEAHFVCEVRPALQFESLLETMFALAADGKTNRKGMPNPLRLAVIANAHFDTVRLPFPPAILQRIGLALGSPAGRLLGYTPTYEPGAGVPVALGVQP